VVILAAIVVFALSFRGGPARSHLAAVFSRLGGMSYAPGEAFALVLPLISIALVLLWLEQRLVGTRSWRDTVGNRAIGRHVCGDGFMRRNTTGSVVRGLLSGPARKLVRLRRTVNARLSICRSVAEQLPSPAHRRGTDGELLRTNPRSGPA
jgi:hypothetical protein